MNLTTTRAERSACAGRAIALTRIYANTTIDADCVYRADAAQDACVHDEARRDRRSVQTDDAVLGMVLLGIGYDITVA
jgi:hypothetical protein